MKILMVLTSHDTLGDTGRKTGFWLEEFAAPYYVFLDAGADVTIASPRGGEPPIDPKSDAPEGQTEATLRFKQDRAAQAALAHTLRLAEVEAGEYDAVFYPGGHGPMWDLADDPTSNALIEAFWNQGKPVAAVCHAPAVLRHAIVDGRPLVEGRRVSGFTNTEEAAVHLTDVVPFLVEDELRRLGGHYEKVDDWQSFAITDGRLITGQNPASSTAAAQELVKLLLAARAPRPVTHHRTATVEGVDIFYREAGAVDAPTVVLLHGFPTSSNMFRDLIPALADRYRVIAPDYPGFGFSAMPARDRFDYSFARYAALVDGLLTQLGASSYALYVMDYGAPVGFRLALAHPERVTALVIQNGNAYEEGLSPFWDPIKAYWADGSAEQRDALRPLMTLESTQSQYLSGVKDVSHIDPSAWLHDQALLDRPGNAEIQLLLVHDYRHNVALYPQFQAFFRDRQVPTLIVWGANDTIFPVAGARAFLRDLPAAELHLLDTGHFALEDKADEIFPLMREFLGRTLVVPG